LFDRATGPSSAADVKVGRHTMPAADTNASRSTFTAVSTAAHLIRSGWIMARPKITYIRCAISNRCFSSTFKPLLTRVSEAIQMRRDQLDAKRSRLWVVRLKGSLSVEHPVAGDEQRAIKRYLAAREDNLPWLSVSERQAQLTRQAVNYIARMAGETAKLGRVWPHMLRHSCGYYLADKGTDLRTTQDYLGHRDPKHTAHYTRVAGHRFEGLWR